MTDEDSRVGRMIRETCNLVVDRLEEEEIEALKVLEA